MEELVRIPSTVYLFTVSLLTCYPWRVKGRKLSTMLARCKFNLTEKGRGRKGRERTLREVCFHFFCFFPFFNKRDTTKAFSWKKENVNKRGREGEGKKNPTLSSRLFEGSLIIKYTRIQESCSSLVRQRDVRWRTNNTFNVHSFVGKIFLLAAFLTSRFILLFAASFFFFSLPVRSVEMPGGFRVFRPSFL